MRGIVLLRPTGSLCRNIGTQRYQLARWCRDPQTFNATPPRHSAHSMNRVVPSGPPSIQVKQPRSRSTVQASLLARTDIPCR